MKQLKTEYIQNKDFLHDLLSIVTLTAWQKPLEFIL